MERKEDSGDFARVSVINAALKLRVIYHPNHVL
jgi:hypothetical protein